MSLFIEEEGNIKLDFDTEEIAALVIDAALLNTKSREIFP